MKTSETVKIIRAELIANADEKTKESAKRFFKNHEKLTLYGVKIPVMKKIGAKHFKSITNKKKEVVFAYCNEFWKSGIMEERFIACNWSYNLAKEFVPADFKIFESWIEEYIDNWATCDTFCNHTVGEFLQMYPEFIQELKIWAKSSNQWLRRAAAVSLIVPARKGNFIDAIFEIADILLLDREDLVQKGYGWLLKVAADSHLQKVYDYVIINKSVMPRTALRYAIEKMPKELKAVAISRKPSAK